VLWNTKTLTGLLFLATLPPATEVIRGRSRLYNDDDIYRTDETQRCSPSHEAYDLQVDVTNLSAISFYKRHGFKTVRTLRNYYANGHDAYLMVKELWQA
jgi:ribosomal protein S18 acetylase RimI-like enzyme